MVYVDTMFLPAQSALLGCLTTAAAALSSPPAVIGARYGQEVVFDVSQDADLCCQGFGWVRMGQAVPVLENQPQPCGPLAWDLDLEVGIVGCAPMGDDVSIVTEAQHTVANGTMAEIMMALRQVVCCFGGLGYVFSIGTITPAGPLGGCMGASITLTAQIIGHDTFP